MLLYKIVKFYVKTGLFLFYKNIIISGKENIPKNGPILFVANHQNAMMDPLLVATSTHKVMYFLARASAFKNKIAAKLLNAIHAIAIYRVRDKVDSKKLNEAVFNQCLDLFNQEKNILIFPEGSHSTKRQIRSLRAGFTRMTIDYLTNNPKKDLIIIPVGLNFTNTQNYAESVHIKYGKPIFSRTFFNANNQNKTKGNLINEVKKQLKKVTIHIDDENYEEEINQFNNKDFLFIDKTTQHPKFKIKHSKFNLFYSLMKLNSIFPFLIWYWLKPKIKEKEFLSTAKFSLGLSAFPIFYIIQSLIIFNFFDGIFALTYLIISFILVFLSTKTR